MSLAPKRKKHLWIWFLWIGLFFSVWAWLVFGHDRWEEVKDHWPIALAMALGSYAAGSTPMGGGTVGFPILVLLFDQPAQLGRDFSFAVQSIGMTSAGIFILARRQPLAWAMLKGAMLGSLIGTPLGIFPSRLTFHRSGSNSSSRWCGAASGYSISAASARSLLTKA